MCLFLATGAARADDAGHAAEVRQELVNECDALIGAAVKTPYGWGWSADSRPAAKQGRSRTVTIDLRTTAAAGVALHVAGARLEEPRYAQAAVQAARAVAAVQLNSGQIPAVGVIGANAGGRDAPAAVPSRAATCSAVALLTAVLRYADVNDDGNVTRERPNPAARFRPVALKAASWIAAQQTRSGAWLVAYPPGAAPGEATRLVRLDDTDFRDATVALWLASATLDDTRLRRRAESAVGKLASLRIADDRSLGQNLWSTAYTGDGAEPPNFPELAPAIDVVASRNAMVALLAASLSGDAEATTPVLREAAAALEKLPKRNGAWQKRYDLDLRVDPPAAEAQDAAPPPAEGEDEPPASDVFLPAPTAVGDDETVEGVEAVVRAVDRLAELGPEKFRDALAQRLPLEHRLSLMLCGLDADPFSEGPPAGAAADRDGLDGRLRRIARLAWWVRREP